MPWPIPSSAMQRASFWLWNVLIMGWWTMTLKCAVGSFIAQQRLSFISTLSPSVRHGSKFISPRLSSTNYHNMEIGIKYQSHKPREVPLLFKMLINTVRDLVYQVCICSDDVLIGAWSPDLEEYGRNYGEDRLFIDFGSINLNISDWIFTTYLWSGLNTPSTVV